MAQFHTPAHQHALVVCPIDSSHIIIAQKMPYHMMKHKEDIKRLNLVQCTFNACHWVKKPELTAHYAVCPDSHVIEADLIQDQGNEEGNYFLGDCSVPDYNDHQIANAEEDWDAECDLSRKTFICGQTDIAGYFSSSEPAPYAPAVPLVVVEDDAPQRLPNTLPFTREKGGFKNQQMRRDPPQDDATQQLKTLTQTFADLNLSEEDQRPNGELRDPPQKAPAKTGVGAIPKVRSVGRGFGSSQQRAGPGVGRGFGSSQQRTGPDVGRSRQSTFSGANVWRLPADGLIASETDEENHGMARPFTKSFAKKHLGVTAIDTSSSDTDNRHTDSSISPNSGSDGCSYNRGRARGHPNLKPGSRRNRPGNCTRADVYNPQEPSRPQMFTPPPDLPPVGLGAITMHTKLRRLGRGSLCTDLDPQPFFFVPKLSAADNHDSAL